MVHDWLAPYPLILLLSREMLSLSSSHRIFSSSQHSLTDVLALQGLNFLFMHGLLNDTPEDVAAFLYRGEGLNKRVIGEYLGKK